MKKKRVMAGILVGALAVGGHQVWAATVHYNDSSVTGGSAEWQAWTRQWEQLANDYTQVSVSYTHLDVYKRQSWYHSLVPADAERLRLFG